MLNEELKLEIEKLCNTFQEAFISDAVDMVEHVGYFMLIRKLDKEDAVKEKESLILGIEYKSVFRKKEKYLKIENRLRWSKLKDSNIDDTYKALSSDINEFINDISNEQQYSYLKSISGISIRINKENIGSFTKIINELDSLLNKYERSQGEIFEYLVTKIQPIKKEGRFVTPRHIVDMIVQLMDPKMEDIIMDPACGTGGFLVHSIEYIRKKYENEFHKKENKEHFQEKMFSGLDSSSELARISNINMILHRINGTNIKCVNSLSDKNTDREKYTMIMTNMPFNGALDKDNVAGDVLKVIKDNSKIEGLFTALGIKMLKLGGRCACIVPDGFVSSTQVFPRVREELVEKHKVEAVISIPAGVFRTKNKSGKESGVKASIIIFTKTGCGGTDKVWFYDMEADGYSLDGKRDKVEANDIPDIINRFKNLDKEVERKRTEKSFLVDVYDIRNTVIDDNGKKYYSLSIQDYKIKIYEDIEYEEPKTIIDKIDRLNNEIDIITKDLKYMIGEI